MTIIVAACAWLYVVGLVMSMAAMTFDDDVPRWMQVTIWLLWPLTFVILLFHKRQ